MATNDYGQFVQTMRKIRGFTQDELASMARVSLATVQKFEYNGDKLLIRPSSLDAILTALVSRGPLTPAEIIKLAEGTGRLPESFKAINKKASSTEPGPSDNMVFSQWERIAKAFKILESAGQSELAISQIELLAQTFEVDPSTVVSAQKKVQGETKNAIAQDVTHYEAVQEGSSPDRLPKGMRRGKPPRPINPDSMPDTGTH